MLFRTTFAALLLLPAAAFGQYYGSGGDWDFSLGVVYQLGDSSSGENGTSLKVDDELGFGLSANYHFNRWFALGGDLDFVSPDYSAVLVSEDGQKQNVSHNATQFNGRFKGTLKLMEGPFIPYAQLGVGWTVIDSNVADGPPQTGCWWHPWWGYICNNFYQTYSSTEFSYGMAVGARYEFRGQSFVNLSYDYWELDTGGSRANPALSSVRLQYGWKF